MILRSVSNKNTDIINYLPRLALIGRIQSIQTLAYTNMSRAGALVLWFWKETPCSKGREFESRHHILDGHFSHLFVVKIVMSV